MKNRVLSPFPYFGGKAKMSTFICSLLDYEDTSIYLEPFGGACRVLLSKEPHEQEIYNDFSYVLSGFFEVMTDMEETELLIERLMENPPDKEQFQRLVLQRMAVEDRLNTYTNAVISMLARESYKRTNIEDFKKLYKSVKKEDYIGIHQILKEILENKKILQQMEYIEVLQYTECYRVYAEFWSLVGYALIQKKALAEKEFDKEWKRIMLDSIKNKDISKLYNNMKKAYIMEQIEEVIDEYVGDTIISNEMGSDISDIERAFMAFQLYYCSRDGMGTVWSEAKNKDQKAYYKAVANLRNVARRMENVVVIQAMDAMALIAQYRKNSEVMMYLDPSYLNPKDEQENLGSIYKMSYGYKEHEELLREITKPDTEAKIMISNYDVELYNRYLYDWDKKYYETYTGVGNWKRKGNEKSKASRRIEVLWKNY